MPVVAPRVHFPGAVHVVLVHCTSVSKPAVLGRELGALSKTLQSPDSSTINRVGTFSGAQLLSHRRSAVSEAWTGAAGTVGHGFADT